jgi:iron complex transport system substrate-binding protein
LYALEEHNRSRQIAYHGSMTQDYTPRRIVSLQPSATVMLSSMGKLDRLVACTKYCADVCPELRTRDLDIVADSWTARADEIVAAQPDLVIAAVPMQEKAVAEIMKSGARFLGLAPKTLDDIYTDMAVIAGIMSVPECGELVIARMQEEIAAVRSKSSASGRPRVFCEEWGKPLIASQRWVAELVEAAGGEFTGIPGVQTSAEAVRESDPDILIAAWCGAGDRIPLEKIIRARAWEQMRACRSGRVCCIRDELLNTPSPILIHGLYALAAAIHPELFPQVPGLRCISRDRSRAHEDSLS